jgi:soluble lytic murein transglycosylase-like protein
MPGAIAHRPPHFAVLRFARLAWNALALVGLIAIAWEFAGAARWLVYGAPPAATEAEELQPLMPSSQTADPRRRQLADYLSKRFRVARDATEQVVAAAYDAGRQMGLDPLIILSVIAVESSFNPIAESVMGAKGLMQVIPKYHTQFFVAHGGAETVLDPITNVHVGAKILKSYVTLTGSIEDALQVYNGAASDLSYEYALKVIAERERLQGAIAGVRRQQPGAT